MYLSSQLWAPKYRSNEINLASMYVGMCVYVRKCVCICMRMYIYIYIYTYVCMYVCIYLSMYICVYVYLYVCMYVCIHVRKYVHTFRIRPRLRYLTKRHRKWRRNIGNRWSFWYAYTVCYLLSRNVLNTHVCLFVSLFVCLCLCPCVRTCMCMCVRASTYAHVPL